MDGTGLNLVSEALTNVGDVFDSAVNMITANPIAMLFVGIPIIGAGIGLFHRLIKH